MLSRPDGTLGTFWNTFSTLAPFHLPRFISRDCFTRLADALGFLHAFEIRLPTSRPLSSPEYNYTLRPDAGRFECGTYSVPGLLSMKASIDFLQDIGVEAVAHRLKELTDRLIIGLMLKGYQVLSPRSNTDWSGIVSFKSPTHNHEQIVLAARGFNPFATKRE